MTSQQLNILQNIQGFEQEIFTNICEVRTDFILSRGQVGVYFLDGASSTNALETTTSGAPVVITNNLAVPTAGQALVANSATDATWQDINVFFLDASYFLYPPANVAPNNSLPNAIILNDTDDVEVTQDATTVGLSYTSDPSVVGSYSIPTLTVDIKGRVTAVSNDQIGCTSFSFVAGSNVAVINSQLNSYQRYFDEVLVIVCININTTNVSVPPGTAIVYTFTGLPIAPLERTFKSAVIENSSGLTLNRGVIYVDPGFPDTIFYTTGDDILSGVQNNIDIWGVLSYRPAV